MLFADVTWFSILLNIFVLITGLLLIVLIVVVQRGKGGGLAGAFGGVGGSSAFGTRAGEKITWITIGLAGVWMLLIMVQVVVVQKSRHQQTGDPAAGAFGTEAPNP